MGQTKIQFFVDTKDHAYIESVAAQYPDLPKTHVYQRLIALGIQAMNDLHIDLADAEQVKAVALQTLKVDWDDLHKDDAANERVVLIPSSSDELPW